MDDEKDKEQSVIHKMVERVTDAIGNMTQSTVAPPQEPEKVAEKANEQMLVEDGSVPPEAVAARESGEIRPERSARARRANKRVAKAKKAAPVKKVAKTAKKTSKKKASKKAASNQAAKKATKTTKKGRKVLAKKRKTKR